MALRLALSQKLRVSRVASLTIQRSFANSPLPEDVLDMSINGLQMSSIGAAIINHFKLGSSDPPMQPLGRLVLYTEQL